MKKYPKYKNSGIAWLGDIPEHWGYSKLKKIANFRRGSFPQPYGLAKWYDDENGFPFIQVFDVGKNMKLKPTTKRKISLEATKKSVFIKKGTLVLTLQGSIGRLAVTHYDAYIDRTLLIFQSYNVPIDINYFKHIVAILFEFEEKKAVGSTIKTINKEKLSSFILTIPPKPEQTTIANFLDYKLEKIDRFITKKKQLIELLNEQKAAIINQAVTKGVNPNAKMKPSGIEWWGDIPESWEVMRMKFLGDAIIGLTYSPSQMVGKGEGTLVLRSSNVQNGKITYDDCVYVTTDIPDKKRTRIGDILICSRNGSIKLVGKNALIDKKSSNESFGAFMTVFRSKFYEYLHYFFNSASFKAQSGLFFTSTINQLTTGVLNQIVVAIPNLIQEQKTIVTYIETETKKIEKTISTIEKEIALVEEYKTALIAEAVTGKIDVREFEVPQIEKPLSMVAEEATSYKKV